MQVRNLYCFHFPPGNLFYKVFFFFFFFFKLSFGGLAFTEFGGFLEEWRCPFHFCFKYIMSAVLCYDQPCLPLCDPMDCSPPGSSVYGVSQVRILEWVAISSSRVSSRPRDQTHVSYVSCIEKHIPYY